MNTLKWIQMSVYLAVLLKFTGAAMSRSVNVYSTVRVGEDVILVPDDMRMNLKNCRKFDWSVRYMGNTQIVNLVRRGQIAKLVGSISDRLRVREDCGLLIKKVTEEDAGEYCYRQRLEGIDVHDGRVYLSVVSMTEWRNIDSVMLFCSVTTHEACKPKARWLLDGQYVGKHCGGETPQPSCDAYVALQTDHMNKSRYDSLMCEVAVDDSVGLYSLRLPPPAAAPPPSENRTEQNSSVFPSENRTESITASSGNNTASDVKVSACCSSLDWIMLSLRVSELVLITVITVLLFRASGNHRPPDDFTVCYDRDDITVTYENVEEPSASNRLC
ncbi:uncharacterized protein LOC117824562 [Xyrichtys novacula]|uniref:Uncharacterized protein LOC117824562 n=1 Tax=Xyrichtys novacula TaxID=13765 RepID=A0AAV1GZP0_XYRNO|nr:uncharacterized protein LOC117824562 [Xyrichtys novacula]